MKILIADDQPQLGRLLQEQLRPWGYEAAVVHDGLAALEALRAAGAPRLALLDWTMPGLDGIEVCRRLRRETSESYAYLMLITAWGGRERMLQGLESGADDFLTKPIDDAELKARLGTGRRIIIMQEQLREMATRDALTGLFNRAAILDLLDRELVRASREKQPLGVVLADLDHFKAINDVHGHPAGDEVLRQAAGRMLAGLRPYDGVGRYGGEEFLMVLPGCDGWAAATLAERLRACVVVEPVAVAGGAVGVTLSLGVAAYDGRSAVGSAALLRAADEALYQAKRSGRNRVARAGDRASAR